MVNIGADLFDDEGFSLSDINETVVGTQQQTQIEGIYFLDSDEDPLDDTTDGNQSGPLPAEEDMDLRKAKVSNIFRSTRTTG